MHVVLVLEGKVLLMLLMELAAFVVECRLLEKSRFQGISSHCSGGNLTGVLPYFKF